MTGCRIRPGTGTAPRGRLFRARLAVRLSAAFYDDGLAEIEWTIKPCTGLARGIQALGPVYDELCEGCYPV